MWKDIISSVAPKLASAIGGPFAGVATKFIAGKLLGDETATESDIAAYIEGASPEQLGTLKSLDNDFEIEMRRLGVEEYGIEVEDRKSARLMADKRPQIILSGVYTIGYFTLVFGLLANFLTIPEEGRDLIIGLIGILTAAQTQLLNFWFGSSSGSKDKNSSPRRGV